MNCNLYSYIFATVIVLVTVADTFTQTFPFKQIFYKPLTWLTIYKRITIRGSFTAITVMLSIDGNLNARDVLESEAQSSV